MQIAADRIPKGRLKMRGLVLEIRAFWDACGQVEGHLVQGGGLHLHDLDHVVLALDSALVTIRTLDHEVFEASDPGTYLAARNNPASAGRTVRGLTGPRNSAVHKPDVFDPDVASAAGPMPGTTDRYLINPRWKPRTELPAAVFSGADGKPQQSLADAYDATCAGVSVLDTLLDAFAFFDGLAPGLARRKADGSVEGFPLPPYNLAAHYRRLAPDWPTEREGHRILRQQEQETPSTGSRTILGRISPSSGVVLCGDTDAGSNRTHSFTETPEQVVRDITNGAEYYVVSKAGKLRCSVDGGVLSAPNGPLDLDTIPDLGDDSRPWADWWALCQEDAHHYRLQRRP